jgi:hypothetical protein
MRRARVFVLQTNLARGNGPKGRGVMVESGITILKEAQSGLNQALQRFQRLAESFFRMLNGISPLEVIRIVPGQFSCFCGIGHGNTTSRRWLLSASVERGSGIADSKFA